MHMTCQSRLKSTNGRPCPNPSTMERYLKETINFEAIEGNITKGEKFAIHVKVTSCTFKADQTGQY